MLLGEVLQKTKDHFQQKKFSTAKLDAELLFCHALQWQRIDLYLKQDYPLQDKELERCRDLVRRRSQGEPVAYILGEKEFYSLSFQVGPGVLIPRPETEHIVDRVLEIVNKDKELHLLDIGCGTSCISISILNRLPKARASAVDISEAALFYATKNAHLHSVHDRLDILKQDIFVFQPQRKFDLIVCNPPYIAPGDSRVCSSVLKFEPNCALFADNNGYAFYQKIFPKLKIWLKLDGRAIFEMGDGQSQEIQRLAKTLDFRNISVISDYSGVERLIEFQNG